LAETSEELYARAKDALRAPPVEEWKTWPFQGSVRPRALEPPAAEPARHGEGGNGCGRCAAGDDEYLWTNDRWRIKALGPTGLPLITMLETRAHHADPGDLSDYLAGELGLLLARMERAMRGIGEIGRVHVGRWGDGSEHLHWWLFARPARMHQLSGSFAAIWDDVLPPLPEEIWRENVAAFARGLE
jgi:hypothetical protein